MHLDRDRAGRRGALFAAHGIGAADLLIETRTSAVIRASGVQTRAISEKVAWRRE
jgi:hypothetical protein